RRATPHGVTARSPRLEWRFSGSGFAARGATLPCTTTRTPAWRDASVHHGVAAQRSATSTRDTLSDATRMSAWPVAPFEHVTRTSEPGYARVRTLPSTTRPLTPVPTS